MPDGVQQRREHQHEHGDEAGHSTFHERFEIVVVRVLERSGEPCRFNRIRGLPFALPLERVRFDASRGVPFAGFAAMRIRGAILDGLRASDTLSRGERKRAKLDAAPTAARVISDDEQVAAAVDAGCVDAGESLVHDEMIDELRQALDTLSERERYIVQRHFFDEVAMRAIGVVLGVTESRISQIVTGAVARLRQRFGIAILQPKRKTAPAPRRAATLAAAA